MIGRPSVTLTAAPNPAYLSTGKPWSWYIASTASRCPPAAQVHGVAPLAVVNGELGNDRSDHGTIFSAEVAIFARVRIQAADNDFRFDNTEASPQVVQQNSDNVAQTFLRYRIRHIPEWQMRGRECDAEISCKQQHDGQRRTTDIGDEFRMTGERKSAVIDDVIQHIGERELLDDLTLVVLKQQ